MGSFVPNEDYPAIVIDNGSSTCRTGIAGEDAPSSVFPSFVGRRKFLLGEDRAYVGNEAQDMRELLNLTYPIDHGIVVNWDDMEKIWDHAFYSELKISPQQHPILISEPPLNPKGNREKMAQVLFEKYKAPAIFVAYQPLLSLYGAFRYQGVVVSVGDGVVHVVPICHTQVQFQAARRSDFAGSSLTKYLQRLLYNSGYCFTSSAELEMVREIKEKMCFTAADRSHFKQLSSAKDSKCVETYKLPDGTSVKLDRERYMCPEILFEPDGEIHTGKSLPRLIESSVNDIDMTLRRDMYSCVILSGGSSFFPKFTERLQRELLCLTPPGVHHVKLCAHPFRRHQEWAGGSLLASLSTFQDLWVSVKDYEEYGPSIICRNKFC